MKVVAVDMVTVVSEGMVMVVVVVLVVVVIVAVINSLPGTRLWFRN